MVGAQLWLLRRTAKRKAAHRHVGEVMTWLNKVASASESRGEAAPFPRHIHNMEGGPLNVIEVARTM